MDADWKNLTIIVLSNSVDLTWFGKMDGDKYIANDLQSNRLLCRLVGKEYEDTYGKIPAFGAFQFIGIDNHPIYHKKHAASLATSFYCEPRPNGYSEVRGHIDFSEWPIVQLTPEEFKKESIARVTSLYEMLRLHPSQVAFPAIAVTREIDIQVLHAMAYTREFDKVKGPRRPVQ